MVDQVVRGNFAVGRIIGPNSSRILYMVRPNEERFPQRDNAIGPLSKELVHRIYQDSLSYSTIIDPRFESGVQV